MSSSNSMRKSVGIVREVYNKWERRAPLTPAHVRSLVQSGVQVLIQPSHSRIFSDEQYALAGARVTEDLSPANVIVGVKQVPTQELLPEKTYMFFSHTIKAQQENMELLDTVLQKKIMLIDYECITEQGERNGKRLIAFGGNAGRAGMVAGFRGIGERLINMGYSTPFVNVGSSYMYTDLERAKEAVEIAGKKIKQDGLPSDLSPMTFVFTGNGNVSKGAQEIFRLMPHEMVDPSELPNLPRDNRVLYGTVVQDDFMVQPIDPSRTQTREDYYQNPHLYEGIFHEKIAPHASMIVNCMYWDDRFPRLLTRQQLEDLRKSGNKKLLGIADISCDIGGSVEFLEYSTEIERPFALYDVNAKKMKDDLEGDGVMMMSVDILPSELARESSQQFGDKLLEYVNVLSGTDARAPLTTQKELPKELLGACIASNGVLTPKFQYIHRMRAERERSKNTAYIVEKEKLAGSSCLRLDGHLFDTGLINQVLNVIEEHNGQFHLVDCQVRPNFIDASSESTSSAIIQISMDTREELNEIIAKVKALSELTAGAHASVTELPDFCGLDYSKTHKEGAGRAPDSTVKVTSQERRKVVCFGAGLVAAPLVEYLSREASNEVHVVSGLEGEANRMLRKFSRSNISPHTVDVSRDKKNLEKLCAEADCVVSLLPATMHTDVAKLCIQHRTPLVTASYISPEMRQLHEQAKNAGIPILCELGLDPGMDHMSAMKVIDEVKAHDGKIVSFSSVCGGLPAPEAADNPIAYKFSWSPRGVLTAALNSAQYRKNGKIINIAGVDLLKSNEKVNFLPAFAIEQIPNRDSLPYADIYGIPDAHTIFRGTLRYAGTCDILFQLRNFGLFDIDPSTKIPSTWPELINQLVKTSNVKLQPDAQQFLQWLGVYDPATPLTNSGSVIDTFCTLLMEKLAYQPGERDMAIMHHEFGIEYANGKKETRTSTYVGYGSEQGDTVMAKTVGLTAAMGVQMVLQDAIQSRGVLTPTTPDIYVPALARLEVEGIRFIEKTFPQL
ncbi:Alpha-aminoadipic semialdehyde synthase [Globisporangium polare]